MLLLKPPHLAGVGCGTSSGSHLIPAGEESGYNGFGNFSALDLQA